MSPALAMLATLNGFIFSPRVKKEKASVRGGIQGGNEGGGREDEWVHLLAKGRGGRGGRLGTGVGGVE